MRRTNTGLLALLGGVLLAAGLLAQAPADNAVDGSTPLHLAVRQNDL
jgi:hypothetical protein